LYKERGRAGVVRTEFRFLLYPAVPPLSN